MPLLDKTGSKGAGLPLHIDGTVVKVGVTAGVTVTFKVVCVAHWPTFGVNVYVALVLLLTIAGDQVPVIPFNEVVGNTGATLPLQNGGIAANVGKVPAAVTVTINVAGKAHCPVFGVKVYVVVAVLFTIAGFQVPVNPFNEVVGNAGAVLPLQMEAMAAKEGSVDAIVKLRQPGSATFPQRSVTEPEAFVKHTW